MIKIKGKEYPVSLIKAYIHDDILKKLEKIRKKMSVNTDQEVMSACIVYVYNIIEEMEKLSNKSNTADMSAGSIKTE